MGSELTAGCSGLSSLSSPSSSSVSGSSVSGSRTRREVEPVPDRPGIAVGEEGGESSVLACMRGGRNVQRAIVRVSC